MKVNNRLKSCLRKYSKNGNLTSEYHNGQEILQFDLVIDDSENKWGDLQPMVSAVSIEDGQVESYNIRLGKTENKKTIEEVEMAVQNSNPPCMDKFDTGHSIDVTNPHIRMNDGSCSVEEFTDFIERLMKNLTGT